MTITTYYKNPFDLPRLIEFPVSAPSLTVTSATEDERVMVIRIAKEWHKTALAKQSQYRTSNPLMQERFGTCVSICSAIIELMSNLNDWTKYKEGTFLCRNERNEVLGILLADLTASFQKSEDRYPEICYLTANPNHFQSGAGSALLRHIEQLAQKQLQHVVFLFAAKSSVSFYQKNGYGIVNPNWGLMSKEVKPLSLVSGF